MSRRQRGRPSRARRLHDGNRHPRPQSSVDSTRLPLSPFSIYTPTEWRHYLSVIFDEALIEAALRERHLVPELPASIWLDLERMLHRMQRLRPNEWKQFCAGQSEILRQLLVLFVLDFEATARAMQAKLCR